MPVTCSVDGVLIANAFPSLAENGADYSIAAGRVRMAEPANKKYFSGVASFRLCFAPYAVQARRQEEKHSG